MPNPYSPNNWDNNVFICLTLGIEMDADVVRENLQGGIQ